MVSPKLPILEDKDVFSWPRALHWKAALSVMGIRFGAGRSNGIRLKYKRLIGSGSSDGK